MSRTYTRLIAAWAAVVALICLYVVIGVLFSGRARTLQTDVIQGVLVGFGLAFATLQLVARLRTTKVNGWVTMRGCGTPGAGILQRAACAQVFLGPINAPEEAMYWWTNGDATGRALDGRRGYVLRFPPGGLPPNEAFWSVTMVDARNRFVPNPVDRYCVSDRSGLVANPDGSVDVLIQRSAPAGRESNWLPAPAGPFILWLRVYLPGPAVLDGTWAAPPVLEQGGDA